MKDLISVIVPVYNVENFLEKCLDSLVNQTYKNIEIILVNDCSTDNSLDVINRYQKKDKRIILINNDKNSGAAFSRNKAIKESKGNYIGFIDSDDYISLDFYEKLITKMKEDKSDLGIADIKVIYDETNEEVLCNSFDNKVTKLDAVNTGLAASSCNKLFSKELISKYEYAEGKVNEDIAVVIPAIINAKKITYVQDVFYHYIQRKLSVQNSNISPKKFDVFDAVDLTLKRIEKEKDFEKLKESIVFQQLINFYLYVIPKEKNVFKRYNYIKKTKKLLSKYDYKNNTNFKEFLNLRTKKELIYLNLLTSDINIISNTSITLYKVFKKIRDSRVKDVTKKNITIEDIVKVAIKNSEKKKYLSLSVVVPNYNYENYMLERIYSILNQDVKISELLILDDCSKDDSRVLIDEIVENLKGIINIKSVYNETNSGSAFKQWKKGMDLATGEYVWIAEADDYSDKRFLKSVVKPILNDKDIIVSYVDTSFIDKSGKICLKTIKHEIDIQKTNHWDNNYVIDGKEEFNKYTYLNCTIANVSSAIIKKGDYKNIFEFAGTFKQAGDWVMYASLYQLGKVSFVAKQYNFYRLHGNNVSSTTKKDAHLKEIIKIHEYYEKEFGINKSQKKEIEKRYKFLKKVWKID